MQAIATITAPDIVRKILAHIGEATAPPGLDPPRYAEIEEADLAA